MQNCTLIFLERNVAWNKVSIQCLLRIADFLDLKVIIFFSHAIFDK